MFTVSFLPGFMMILLVYFGESNVWSVVIFTISMSLNGVVTGGYLENGFNIAPNLSGNCFKWHKMFDYTKAFFTSFILDFLYFRYDNWNGKYFSFVWRVSVYVRCWKTYQWQC